jgi:hypothetical protein
MNMLKQFLRPRRSAWLIAGLALLCLPVFAASDAASGRYISFDDYSLTTDGPPPTWQHFGGAPSGPAAAGLLDGTNHLHKSNWSFMHCRMGRSTFSTNNISPDLNGNPYVPNGTNYCLYLQNRLEVLIHSPVFIDGVATLSLDAISLTANNVSLSIYIATNMLNGVGSPVPLDDSANTNQAAIVWVALPVATMILSNGAPQIAYSNAFNLRKPVCFKIVRNDVVPGIARDNYYAVIDNLRVTLPPILPIYDLDPVAGRYLSFDDYSLTNGATPTWQHFGGMPTLTILSTNLLAGTNHIHQSGWSFMHCRMGRSTYSNNILPVLNGNPYVPNGTNYCLYLQNRLEVLLHSPVFMTGAGTLYMDALSMTSVDVNLSVYIATNMVNGFGDLVPIDASANSNRSSIVWDAIPIDSLALLIGAPKLAYRKQLNIRQPVCIKITRNDVFPGIARDNYYAVIDNLRLSPPPADVIMDQGNTPFDTYPSVNNTFNLQLKVSNAPGPYTSVAARRNVSVVSRWNYLGQFVTRWTTNDLTCVDTGDGLGNNELWQPSVALPRHLDAGNLEYYFTCSFEGEYYQSKDYTVYPVQTNLVLFPPENKSPRIYSESGITQTGGTNNPFVFPLRFFPSSYDKAYAVLFVNGSSTPTAVEEMSLVNTNRWQAKYNVIDNTGVTNILWYFEATGAYTNAFATTTEKVYWKNKAGTVIQNGALPYGDNCEISDSSITNNRGQWFGVTVTPGESSYVLFTLDTGRTNYIAGRGEHQNFNSWILGSGTENFFTDADDKHPKTSYTQFFSNGWQRSVSYSKSNYFIGSTLYTTTELNTLRTGPEQILNYTEWAAGVFQYVAERTVGNTLPDFSGTASQRRNQAVRLLGGNAPFGFGYFQGNENQRTGINGIGTLNYKARLSRPLATDLDYNYNVAYRFTDMARSNYMITATGFRANGSNFSPEKPSISLIAYYQNPRKFYEYRLSQVTDTRDLGTGTAINTGRDKRIRHEIWKWNGSNTPTMIAAFESANANFPDSTSTYDAKLSDTFDLEFRVSSDAGLTSLAVKFKGSVEIPFVAYNGATMNTTVVQDSSTPIRFGTYGFHSADCAIVFPTLSLKSTGVNASPGVGTPEPLIGASSSNHQNEWYYPSELYTVSGLTFISANSPAPTAQINVLTGTTEIGPWTTFANQSVDTYSFQSFSATTNDWRNLCVRLEVTSTDNVVVDSINVTDWRAKSAITSSLPSDGWKITEGWLSSNATDRSYAHLDASQANPSLIQGVRSKQLVGIGSIVFEYRVLTAPAKLKIQYTPNSTPSDTSNVGWVDVTNFTFADTNGWVSTNLFFGIAPATNLYVRIINDLTFTNKSVVDLRNITIWDNPTNSPNDWVAYNMKITATETNKWWLDQNRSGYLNNDMFSNTISNRPMDQFEPYIMAPRLTRGLGTVSFLARAFTTNYTSGATNTSISIFATTDPWDKYKPDYGTNGWTKLYTFTNITNGFYRPLTYNHPVLPNNYKAIKLVVEGVRPAVTNPPRQRVCLDEIVISEAIYPRFDITGVKLILPSLPTPTETKQPLEGEDIGVQAQLTNVLLDPKNIQLWVTYVVGTNTWGVFNAPATNQFTKPMDLVDSTNNIYRITGDFMITGIPEQEKYTVVQYLVWAEYYREGSPTRYLIYQTPDTADHFVNPSWYRPVDFNRVGNVETGALKPTWSPYYIVYDVPPGSVWINELNLNENNTILLQKVYMNPYIEIAQPAWLSLKGWTVEILDRYYTPRLTKTIDSSTVVSPALGGNGYGLFVIGPFDFEANNALPPYPPLSTTSVVHQSVQNIRGDSGASLYPGGYRLKRPMGMYEQAISYDWDPQTITWITGSTFANNEPAPQTPFRYVGREHYNGSLSFTGAVNITVGQYVRTDSTNSWQQGLATTNWTPGKMNFGQSFPDAPMPGGSNVVITSTLLSPDGLTHGWQNGERLNPVMFKMRKGQGTNFVYIAEPWFRFYGVISNNVQILPPGQQTVITNYTFTLTNVQTNTTLVADLRLAPHVINDVTTQDMINWLQQYIDRPLAPTYLGIGTNSLLGLLEEYWLNLDPTQTNRLIFAQKAVEPGTNSLWLTLEMATVNGLGVTNRITFLRGDAMVAVWAKDFIGSLDPWRPFGQYWISPRSFDSNYLARTRINSFTNTTAWFKWTLDHNDLRLATNELINIPAGP